MKRRILVLTCCSVIFLSGIAYSEQMKDHSKVNFWVGQLMGKLGQEGVPGVLKGAKENWIISDVEFDQTIKNSTTERARRNYGRHLGVEEISTQKLSDSLYLVTMLEKTESTGIIWDFLFYKPKDVWVLQSCMWDARFGRVLDIRHER